jgi:hypothetical protein
MDPVGRLINGNAGIAIGCRPRDNPDRAPEIPCQQGNLQGIGENAAGPTMGSLA